MSQPTDIQTSIKTSDGAAKGDSGYVYFIAVSAGATGGAFQINDSTDDSGTDRLNLTMPANSALFMDFSNNPIHCKTGIYVDIPGTNVTVNVGYI